MSLNVLAISSALLFLCSYADQEYNPNGKDNTIDDNAYGLNRTYWPTPSDIVVCWETHGYTYEKDVVRQTVAATWEKYSRLRFKFWGRCVDSPRSADIRILVADAGAHVLALGSDLKVRMFIRYA